jgi:hypothetical protein
VTAVYRTGQSPPSPEASAITAKLGRALQPQVIHFGPLASHAVGVSFAVSASASSGLQVSFSSDTPHVCTVSGSTVRTVAAGRCEIRASQAGNADFQLAADVIQGFTVTSGFTPHHGQAVQSTGPRALVVVLLAASILALLAAGLMIIRHRSHSRPPATQAASVRAEAQEGPPAAVHIRVAGTDTHVVRIEPHTGAHSTMIKEVQS